MYIYHFHETPLRADSKRKYRIAVKDVCLRIKYFLRITRMKSDSHVFNADGY